MGPAQSQTSEAYGQDKLDMAPLSNRNKVFNKANPKTLAGRQRCP